MRMYEDVRGKTEAWRSSLEHDVAWLTAVVQDDHDGVLVSDWNGYMFNLAQQSGITQARTCFAFGRLIEAPLSHSDTVLKALLHATKFVTNHGMNFLHVVVDMQLFK